MHKDGGTVRRHYWPWAYLSLGGQALRQGGGQLAAAAAAAGIAAAASEQQRRGPAAARAAFAKGQDPVNQGGGGPLGGRVVPAGVHQAGQEHRGWVPAKHATEREATPLADVVDEELRREALKWRLSRDWGGGRRRRRRRRVGGGGVRGGGW